MKKLVAQMQAENPLMTNPGVEDSLDQFLLMARINKKELVSVNAQKLVPSYTAKKGYDLEASVTKKQSTSVSFMQMSIP